ncbi:hypothetical protein FNH88_19050 [Salmonella enterica subsp. salamae]|nr:hypothetical protein [Salmonella enterica subsp. salamae]
MKVTLTPQSDANENATQCNESWLPATIKEIHSFWLDVNTANPIAGYVLLFGTLFLVWYAIYSLKAWAKSKKIDIELDKAIKKTEDA